MYVLTTKNGGCIVDSVSQISMGDNPLIAVAVMKKNYRGGETLLPGTGAGVQHNHGGKDQQNADAGKQG